MASTANVKMDKKQKRKELNEKLAELRRLLGAANEENDLLRHFPSFQSYCRNDLSCDIVSYGAAAIPAPVCQWAFELCKANMQAMYEPVWGWNDKKKQRQLAEPDSRFLVAMERCSSSGSDGSSNGHRQTDSSDHIDNSDSRGSEGRQQPVAYVNFRFDQEDAVPVVYCYEVQLEDRAQRKGLGRFLMCLLELLGAKYGMQTCMLTVMKANTSALSFYRSLGYTLDPDSPPEEECGYQILSKSLVRRSAATAATPAAK